MINNVLNIENVTALPKSAAKVAAGFLILTTVQYNPATDIRRATQAKFFEEPAAFVKTQQPSNLVVLLGAPSTYNPATDVRRASQAKVFSETETFVKTQTSNPVVLAAFVTQPQIFSQTRYITVEGVASVIKSNRGTLNALTFIPAPPQSADIFSGQDTYGWPKESAEPETFLKTQQGFPLVTGAFTAYNPATDVRRAQQAKYFQEPEIFTPPTHLNYVINNTFPYNPATDATRLKRQALYFAEPEVFLKTKGPLSIALNFTPYVPATDIRRARQALAFTGPEVFARPAPFNRVITDGLVQTSPLEFAHGIDIYDYLNGSVLVAWGAFTLAPQGYNVYVNILGQPDVFYGFTSTLQMAIHGLTTASYNVGTQTQTPSSTYQVKIVAISNGLERGEIARIVTPGPTSVQLTTPMKRLYPFPNTGLN